MVHGLRVPRVRDGSLDTDDHPFAFQAPQAQISRVMVAIWQNRTVIYFVRGIGLILVVLFADSLEEAFTPWTIGLKTILRRGSSKPRRGEIRLFRAQRNSYLTGFALFLLLVIFRMTALLSERIHHEQTTEAIKAQVSGGKGPNLLDEDEEIEEAIGGS